jgi:hypothetical protein
VVVNLLPASPSRRAASEAALAAIGRLSRELVVLDLTRAVGSPTFFSIGVGDRYQTESLALGFGPGEHILGRTHPDSPYPKQVTRALLFEGSQCVVSISDRVVITRDVSRGQPQRLSAFRGLELLLFDFAQHHNVRWLEIDDVTAAQLAERLRRRAGA